MTQSEIISPTRLAKLTYSKDFGSPIRGWLRVIAFFGLVIALFPIQAVRLMFGIGSIYTIPQLFHRTLMKAMGFKIIVHGTPSQAPSTLFAANHTSYLDIPVLASLIPASFIAKSEVATWPLIGFLSTLQKTLFIERKTSQLTEQRDQLTDWLQNGHSMILFPEGTSSDGQMVLPFKSSLFSVVEVAAKSTVVTIQPVSLICTKLGNLPLTSTLRPYYSWFGDMTLVSHLWDVFCMGDFTVAVTFHPPVNSKDMGGRKALAAYCQNQITRGIEAGITGRQDNKLGELPRLSH